MCTVNPSMLAKNTFMVVLWTTQTFILYLHPQGRHRYFFPDLLTIGFLELVKQPGRDRFTVL